MKRHTLFGCFACVLSLATWSHGQAIPTASRSGGTIQVGIGGTFVSPDYTTEIAKGPAVYIDYNFTKHIGVEGDFHFASLITPNDVGENTYLVGPRYTINRGRLDIYGKVLFGLGEFQFQAGSYSNPSNATYGVFAGGLGLDVRATRHINVRAIDFEYQSWPGFPPSGLSPTAITVGVAYVFR